ncbi:hypothetical protein OF001_U140130 [Pseudomonas sp. OF001]|nr:hypothetical protein OF001_U140130 [Pseudomonas sp. OF001]
MPDGAENRGILCQLLGVRRRLPERGDLPGQPALQNQRPQVHRVRRRLRRPAVRQHLPDRGGDPARRRQPGQPAGLADRHPAGAPA